MACKLCGLPTPEPPVLGDGHAFCCIGCREVYRHFGAGILEATAGDATEVRDPPVNAAEVFLRIDGMHCASCEFLISRIAENIDGIHSIVSSYATSTAKVVYDREKIEASDLPGLLSVAGYRAWYRAGNAPDQNQLLPFFRLVVATSLAAVVMMLYLAFYYPTHLGLVDYADLEPVGWLAFGVVPIAMFVLTTILVFYVGLPIFRGALIGLSTGVLNMDNLLLIAILAAYGYSTVQLLNGSHDLYFDVAAAIVTVVTIGRYFERGARESATEELTGLMEAWTPVVRIRENGKFRQCSVDEVMPDTHLFIRQGEAVPVDGIIVEGQAAIDASLMTGEPFPGIAGPGDKLLGGSIVVEGSVEIDVGEQVESQVDALSRILWNVQSSTGGLRGLADRIARIFVPAVLLLAAAVTILAVLGGATPRDAMLLGLATLIVSCPCTFGLAMPLAKAAGVAAALRRGIIITSADVFEKQPRFDIVAFDKTGTLSMGRMKVTEVIGPPETGSYAAAVERQSAHPIAEAVARLDQQYSATEIDIHPGRGAVGQVDGHRVAVGSSNLFASLGWKIPVKLASDAENRRTAESVISYVGWDGSVAGAIVTRDQRRLKWRNVVGRLRRESRVVLLSGAEHHVGYQQHMDEIHVGVPPEAKAAIVAYLKSEGTVAMIGDGSNDAPALAAADLGIAFGAPTALAAEAADVVVPGDRLESVFDAFHVIKTTRWRMRQNLGWALLYNATAIPLAVSGHLNPLFAALAMSTSSLLVVWNSSRKIFRNKDQAAEETAARSDPGELRNRTRLVRE